MPSLARSRSKTTDVARTSSPKEASKSIPSRSSTLSPANPTLTESETETAENGSLKGTMATTVTTQRTYTVGRTEDSARVDPETGLEVDDSGSSSLSDVDDAPDEQALTSPEPSASRLDEDLEDDSEAETERLDQITPRPRRATLNDGKFSSGKTSSALARELDVDSEMEGEASPSSRVRDADLDELDPLGSLASIATSVAEHTQRKRKRSSSEGSILSDTMDVDEPARKRSYSQRDGDENGELEPEAEETNSADNLDAQDDEAAVEEEGEAGTGDLLPEAEDEEVALEETRGTKPLKGKKGKRKGRKIKEADQDREPILDNGVNVPEVEGDEPADAEAEAEAEEEESTNIDEELTKKRSAMDGLTELEKYFIAWRKSYLSVELIEIEKEISLLEGPISQCKHPDFLARRIAIDQRREEKLKYENTLRLFKREQESTKLVAGRQQIGSQYFQSIRHLRDSSLERCNTHFHAIQRDRRRWGADERNHLRMFNPDRRQQITDQTKINREVSILAGVAKYHGFPAAPSMNPIKRDFADDDLREMGVNPQPVQRAVPRQPALTDTANAHTDRTEAAAEFYEQTPWANPLHPAHQQNTAISHFYNPPRASSGSYSTPVAQSRVPSGPNGSASTIEALSNQNSSAIGPNPYRLGEQTQHLEETPMPAFRQVGSGASPAPPPGAKREASLPEASQTSASSKPFALHAESSVNQPFPTSAMHANEAPRETENTIESAQYSWTDGLNYRRAVRPGDGRVGV